MKQNDNIKCREKGDHFNKIMKLEKKIEKNSAILLPKIYQNNQQMDNRFECKVSTLLLCKIDKTMNKIGNK